MRGWLRHWIKLSRIPNSTERPLWRNKRPSKRTVSFAVDRLPTWSTNNSGSLEPMILSKTTPTCSPLFFEMTIFRNSILSGTEYYCLWRKSRMMTCWKDCTNSEYECLRNSRLWWNCTIWRFIRRKLDLIITDWRLWWKEVWGQKWKLWKNAVVKNQETKQRVQRILGDCWQWETNGQCVRGDNCSFPHDINNRAKTTQPNPSPSSSTRQNDRNASRTRSPRGKGPSGRMSRWPCKDYLKELAPIHSVKSEILQNACSASPRVGADLEKSALMRIARLMNSLVKGTKRMMTKVQWPCWKGMSNILERRNPLYTIIHQVHDNWVAYFRTWSRRSLHRFYGRAQTYGNRFDV